MSKEPNLNELAFEVSLPVAILLNENLEPNAIKLYAFVKGLTRAHGYCYATNAYLATCMKCDESTVKRLLASLVKENFLKIETNRNGIHWQRHIFLGVDLKKSLRRLKNEPPPAQICAPPSSKMSPIYNEYINKNIEIEREGEPLKPPQTPIFSFKRIKMEMEKYQLLIKELGKPKVDEMLDRLDEYADLNPKRFKQYACHATVIRKWVRDDANKKPFYSKANPTSNLQWIEKAKTKLALRQDIYFGNEAVVFSGGQTQITMRYDDHGFRDQFLNRLRKMNIPVEAIA